MELLDFGPVVSLPSPIITISPTINFSEFPFLGVESEAAQEVDALTDVLLMPNTSVTGESEDFGEVYTDINQLIMMDGTTFESLCYEEEQVCVIDEADVPSCSSGAADKPSSVIGRSDKPSSVIGRSDVPSSVIGEDEDSDEEYTTVKPRGRKRKFSESTNNKSVKYLERRKKNNIASKRSREMRRNKFLSMDDQVEELERSNAQLRERINELESLTKRMKEALVARLSTTSQ